MRGSIVIIIPFLFFFLACRKTDNGVVPAITTRTVEGTVYLYDQFGRRLPNSPNVTIIITGTTSNATYISSTASYISASTDTTLSDSSGNYFFSNINEGSYTITYQKSGFGTYQKFNFIITGSSNSATIPQATLQPYSTTVPLSLTVDTTGAADTTIRISATIDTVATATEQRELLVFVGTDSTVSSTHYDYPVRLPILSGNSASVNFYAYTYGYSSGTKLYFIAYGFPTGPSSSYISAVTQQVVYPSLNPTPSAVTSITVP